MASNILITIEILNTLTHTSFGCFSSSPLDFPRSIKFNSFDITHTCENVWLHKEIIHIREKPLFLLNIFVNVKKIIFILPQPSCKYYK